MEDIIQLLLKRAKQGRENAYVPYSKFKVGAAVLNGDGEVYTGCNIENVSYGLTNCAERTAIFKAVSNGKKDLKAIAIVADVGDNICMPCGACRQVIAEFMGEDSMIICANTEGDYKMFSVEDILPGAFTPKDLAAGAEREAKDFGANKNDTQIPTI